MVHFTLSKIDKYLYTFPCCSSNQITKEYYNMLVGAINNGEVNKSVCRIENKIFGIVSYYLISKSSANTIIV